MKIIRCPEEMQNEAKRLRLSGKTIGFVPTMGYLHEGHLSLIRVARKKADVMAVSIFVNPAQFGPNEDLDAYPRDFARDEQLCRETGADYLFYPSAETLYSDRHSTWVNEDRLAGFLCGASRPGHFRGVCTVVAKLLNLVLPDFIVLGEKDAQQLRVLRRMIRDLNFPVDVIAAPTVREADGLALSSRNARLTPAARGEAVCLIEALNRARTLFEDGERDAGRIKEAMREVVAATSGEMDYIELVDDETLQPVEKADRPVLAALAVRFSDVRLIDNLRLSSENGGR